MSIRRRYKIYLLIVVVCVFYFKSSVLAYVMSSTNYRVQFDSVNNGGGLGTSTDYNIETTVGEVGSGYSSSTSFNLYGGYQQMDQNSSLSLTVPSVVNMSPSIPGLTGGTANGQAIILVSTNDSAGYSLAVNASTSPAMLSFLGYYFDNLSTQYDLANYNWQVPPTSSAFGFTPEGSDLVTKYKDDGINCNQLAGSDTVDQCWDYFSTTTKEISRSATANFPSSATTTIKMRAESGSQNVQLGDTYTATLTITAHVN